MKPVIVGSLLAGFPQQTIYKMWLYFLQGVALALPSIIAPSPLKVFLISRSLAYGWRSTLPATLVPLVTDGPILIISLLVLNQIPVWYLHGLRILGGVFILYIAWRIIKLLRVTGPTLKASEEAAAQSFRQALGINVLNPNPYLLWGLVAGPIVLEAWREVSTAAALAFIVGFYAVFVLGLVGLVLLFGAVGRISGNVNKALNGVAAAALLILGCYQIFVGVTAIVQ
ncbi:MAG: LysE family transporter [Chloroflexi bacterium]|nr:LysE family transporter [Chloroflexota bacterium]